MIGDCVLCRTTATLLRGVGRACLMFIVSRKERRWTGRNIRNGNAQRRKKSAERLYAGRADDRDARDCGAVGAGGAAVHLIGACGEGVGAEGRSPRAAWCDRCVYGGQTEGADIAG